MVDKFELVSSYKPEGDQPRAIEQLVNQVNEGNNHLTLLGATGTGKTFTVSNVIEQINRPTLVIAHNKTLAGQLYSRSEEHTSELQSRGHLVCRLLLEKNNVQKRQP